MDYNVSCPSCDAGLSISNEVKKALAADRARIAAAIREEMPPVDWKWRDYPDVMDVLARLLRVAEGG